VATLAAKHYLKLPAMSYTGLSTSN